MTHLFFVQFRPMLNVNLGWTLLLLSILTLVSLIVFPGINTNTCRDYLQIILIMSILVGFLRHYPLFVNWYFGLGYGFGWAALCLHVKYSMFNYY